MEASLSWVKLLIRLPNEIAKVSCFFLLNDLNAKSICLNFEVYFDVALIRLAIGKDGRYY